MAASAVGLHPSSHSVAGPFPPCAAAPFGPYAPDPSPSGPFACAVAPCAVPSQDPCRWGCLAACLDGIVGRRALVLRVVCFAPVSDAAPASAHPAPSGRGRVAAAAPARWGPSWPHPAVLWDPQTRCPSHQPHRVGVGERRGRVQQARPRQGPWVSLRSSRGCCQTEPPRLPRWLRRLQGRDLLSPGDPCSDPCLARHPPGSHSPHLQSSFRLPQLAVTVSVEPQPWLPCGHSWLPAPYLVAAARWRRHACEHEPLFAAEFPP
mmetsp:Transcript_32239/g.69645  ORF Transcript_32239/g.69645 Transcript_32239/m.69645 type:complete len:263 (-) Transcript_32239:438-1226(-)